MVTITDTSRLTTAIDLVNAAQRGDGETVKKIYEEENDRALVSGLAIVGVTLLESLADALGTTPDAVAELLRESATGDGTRG